MLKIFTVCAGLLSFSAIASTTFNYDGHYDASQYDVSFSINYFSGDGTTKIEGGKLAFAQVGNDQYMYISHPRGFKDLSYSIKCGKKDKDCVAPDTYTVGWDGKTQKDAGGAIGSEFFDLTFNNGALAVSFDPELPEGTNTHTGGANIEFLSTLNYNASLLNSGDFNGSLGIFSDHSPETKACTDGVHSEARSDLACYELANTTENTIAGNLIDWDFDFGIEVKFTGGIFADINSLSATDFGFRDTAKLISLDALHASPAKLGCETDSKGPCDVEVTGGTVKPIVDVPEPSTTAIFAIGLAGLWLQRKKISKA
jgi:hypothetical protein